MRLARKLAMLAIAVTVALPFYALGPAVKAPDAAIAPSGPALNGGAGRTKPGQGTAPLFRHIAAIDSFEPTARPIRTDRKWRYRSSPKPDLYFRD